MLTLCCILIFLVVIPTIVTQTIVLHYFLELMVFGKTKKNPFIARLANVLADEVEESTL